eukprot:4125069-Amphidinium_carterae.1
MLACWIGKTNECIVRAFFQGRGCRESVLRGLPAGAELVAWSGDNPCAIVGLGLLKEGDLAISLGTSDTAMAVLSALPATPLPFGHVFPHPLVDGLWFCMLCYTNGDMTRRHVRNQFAQGSWETFAEGLSSTKSLNDGCMAYYTTTDEITPPLAPGDCVAWRGESPCDGMEWQEH